MSKSKSHNKRDFLRERLPLWLKRAIIPLPLLAALFFAFRLYGNPEGWRFAVENIEWTGLETVDKDSLLPLVREAMPRNLLRVDLADVRGRLEQAVWVKNALVRRRLPNVLAIEITERTAAAVARIGDRVFLVDSEGVVLGPPQAGLPLPSRPVVLGLAPDQSQAATENGRRMRLYREVLADLDRDEVEYSRQISEIDVSKTKRVAVIPIEDPIPVVLGDRDFHSRFRVFRTRRDLYEEFKKKHGAIESVDLSYDKRIIFRTREKAESVPTAGAEG